MKTIIGKNLLSKISQLFDFSKFSKIVILTDDVVQMILISHISLIKKSLNRELEMIVIPPGESQKNINTVQIIWEKMFKVGLDRKSLLINLGGGVVTDMGGFAASTYMRGIDFLNIPTTLLSQVDASVGGKTGINFLDIKNGIGVFKDPIGTVVDVETLKTLPKRELVSAFGEIIKHGVISGREYFDFVTSKKPEEFSQDDLIKIIKESIKIKSEIVKKDPKESGLRKILNFGHTIGHAVESLSWKTNGPLLHGEAIAIGMIAESRLSCSCQPTHNRRGCAAKIIEKGVMNTGLPVKIEGIQQKEILRIILADKKNISGEILFSLPEKIGKVVPNVKISQEIIKKLL